MPQLAPYLPLHQEPDAVGSCQPTLVQHLGVIPHLPLEVEVQLQGLLVRRHRAEIFPDGDAPQVVLDRPRAAVEFGHVQLRPPVLPRRLAPPSVASLPVGSSPHRRCRSRPPVSPRAPPRRRSTGTSTHTPRRRGLGHHSPSRPPRRHSRLHLLLPSKICRVISRHWRASLPM